MVVSLQMNIYHELSSFHRNHHGFESYQCKEMGCYLTRPPECQGPRLTFVGRDLFSIHTEQRGGPRPHCLSHNWDVKPFTESSGEASKLVKKKRKRQRGKKNNGHEGEEWGWGRRKAQPKL